MFSDRGDKKRHRLRYWQVIFVAIALLSETLYANYNCSDVLRLLVVVDGFFQTGEKIVHVGRDRGYVGVSVRSAPDFPDYWFRDSFHPEDYQLHVVHNGDAQRTVEELIRRVEEYGRQLGRRPRIAGVIAGSDTGVPLQDFINSSLRLPGNPVTTTPARSNKAATGEALRRAGVRSVPETEAFTLSEALAWAERHGRWPILVKPPTGTGSDSVFICRTKMEVEQAFQAIYGHRNQVGQTINSVLLQEYLQGPQYIINTVNYVRTNPSGAREQVRAVTDIWYQVRKPPFPSYVYDHNVLMPYRGKLQEALRHYNMSVLDAVDYDVGASHLEVILTKDGPVAIDLNSRLAGGGMPLLVQRATGVDPIGLAIDAQTGRLNSTTIEPYEVSAYAVVVYIRTRGNARMSHRLYPELQKLKEQGIVNNYKFNFDDGVLLGPTKDSDSIIAKVELLSSDRRRLRDVVKQLRTWEADRQFER